MDKTKTSGKLYVCATPLGNLGDITLRVLDRLRQVDLIAAEDTRVTLKLLNHFEISKALTSYKGFAEEKASAKIIRKLMDGVDVALVSDAGMPGISDPGYKIIKKCIDEKIDMEILPGVTAFVTALVYSGLPADRFYFGGFLPRTKAARRKHLSDLSGYPFTLIFYESPNRLKDSLDDLIDVLGNREAVVARELTKKFEEIIRGCLSDIFGSLAAKTVKGEIVIVVEGARKEKMPDFWIVEKLGKLTTMGMSKKDAVNIVSGLFNISKKRVYALSVNGQS